MLIWRTGRSPGHALKDAADWPEWPARPKTFVVDIELSETTQEEAGKSVKGTFMKGLRGQDWGLATSGLTGDFQGWFPEPGAGTEVKDGELGLRSYRADGLPRLNRDEFVAVLRRHAEGWTSVERTTWRFFEFLLRKDGNAARAALHFQLAGPRADRGRTDVQAVLDVEVVKAGDSWKISRLALREGCRIESRRPPFNDVTDATGFHFNESTENRDLHQRVINARNIRTNSGLCVADWNRDGFWDILATQYEKHAVLFVNDGLGGFRREAPPFEGSQDAGPVFAFIDLDGDGLEELVDSNVSGYEDGLCTIAIFTRKDGAWRKLADSLSFRAANGIRQIMIQALIPWDVDGDGLLDLWFGAYSDSESGKEKFNSLGSFDGADNLLFMNKGGLKFSEESDQRGLTGTQYTYAGAFFDFDGDGKTDFYECNDWGPNPVFLGDGRGHFKRAEGHPFSGSNAYTMGVTIADWDNTGNWSVYTSEMYSHAGNRILPLAGALTDSTRASALVMARGNMLFEQSASGAWTESAVERDVAWADWAWACVFADLDNDSDKDLFVANGFTTHADASAPDW